MAETKIHVIELAHSTGGDVPACAEVTKTLVYAGMAMATSWGWPVVLDSLLSAYLTLALKNVGKERVARVLGDCRSRLDQFDAALGKGGGGG